MKASQAINAERVRFGAVQIGIVLLTIVTAVIHGLVLNVMMGKIDLLFTLNSLGYLALLVALFLPQLRPYRGLIRWVFIGYTALTIVAWIFLGNPRTPVGYFTKLVEAGLIVLLLLDQRG